MSFTKTFSLVVAVTALGGCTKHIDHPDAVPGSYYYQMEKTARDMKAERDERDYEDYEKSQ